MQKAQKFDLELFFAALADRTRLRLINLIGDDEVCVCFFVEVIGPNQPKISRHLAYLRRAGLVATRRDGKWTQYRLVAPNHEGAARVLAETRRLISEEPEMKRDREKLHNVCCAVQPPVLIQGAPRPHSLATPQFGDRRLEISP